MKKWMTAALCALLAIAMCVPVLGGETTDFTPYYTPSTQREARCIPLTLEQQLWHEGVLSDTDWHTLYNPETAAMMVELEIAARKVGHDDSWREIMSGYGYTQLQYTVNNKNYPVFRYPTEDGFQEVFFNATNIMVGIKEVEYNGQTRYAIGLVFRGTDVLDLADWLADADAISDSEGFHQGFSQNAGDFYYDLSAGIRFTAGGRAYTLSEIFEEMHNPDSPFCMLVMGHSLGGALADVLVSRYLYQGGVHPSNVAAYTTGAPCSVPKDYDYPYGNICNVVNEDDLVPYILTNFYQRPGRDLCYTPDDDFRLAHYGPAALANPGKPAHWWRTEGFLMAQTLAHDSEKSYTNIVADIWTELNASSPEEPSIYTDFSTCGFNDWGLGDAIISPCTFGDFTGDIHTGGTLCFRQGVLQVKGDLAPLNGLTMHHEDDYLLVEGTFDVPWGVDQGNPDHLTSGTVELKGDFYTGNYDNFDYAYRATGDHRTVLSGTGEQIVQMNDEDVQFAHLYLRNPRVNFQRYVPYFRLEEDAVLTATETLTAWEMDLNGHSLTLDGNLFTYDLTMGGGTLEVSGNAEIESITALNGTMTVGGDLDMAETLVFDSGTLHVTGDCYLPASMTMRKAEDYLRVDGTLTLFAREGDLLPDDHLSAGTVELKGDLQFDDMGICEHNAYHETAGHKTILSGDSLQTLRFHNAASANRLENLCIRNPQTALYLVKDVRLAEDALITLTAEDQRVSITGTLDLNGHTLTVDASGWTNESDPAVELTALSAPNSGRLSVDGDMMLDGGTLSGEVSVTGDLTVRSLLTFAEAQLSVGGNCDLPYGFVMQSDADYLLVGGDLTLWSNSALPSDHLSAGTVELKGDLSANGGDNYYSYHATNTHRTIFSGKGVQRVRMGAMVEHKVLQACLRNPDVVLESVYTLRLMEGAVVNDVSGWHLHGVLDLNGHKLTAQGAFGLLEGGIVDSQAVDGKSAGILQMAVEKDQEEVPLSITISVPETLVEEEDIHILFTGYDDLHRMVVCQAMHFTSESQMTQTLRRENWPDCKTTQIYWLEGDFAPFCTATSLGW